MDVNGEDWIITKEEKDGKTIYNITMNGAVYNTSGKKYDMNKMVSQMKGQIESVFGNAGEGIELNVNVNLRAVESLKDVSESDHLFTVMGDKEYDERYDAKGELARADLGGLKVMIRASTMDKIMSGEDKTTLSHEVGHTAGLYHPDMTGPGNLQWVNTSDRNSYNNLMYPAYFSKKHLENSNDGVGLNKGQIEAMYKNYGSGRINQMTQFEKKTIVTVVSTIPVVTRFTTRNINYSSQGYVNARDRLFGPKY